MSLNFSLFITITLTIRSEGYYTCNNNNNSNNLFLFLPTFNKANILPSPNMNTTFFKAQNRYFARTNGTCHINKTYICHHKAKYNIKRTFQILIKSFIHPEIIFHQRKIYTYTIFFKNKLTSYL